jgi:hypothetical protein
MSAGADAPAFYFYKRELKMVSFIVFYFSVRIVSLIELFKKVSYRHPEPVVSLVERLFSVYENY